MIFLRFFCLLLLFAVCARCRRSSSTISFPTKNYMVGEAFDTRIDAKIPERNYHEGLKAVQSIANKVLKVLENEEVQTSPKNWVVSPLSLAANIAQLLLGSRGRLQSALSNSLSLEGSEKPTSRLEVHRHLGRLMGHLERFSNDSYFLELNGAVFIQPGVRLKPTYKHALLDFYKAQIFFVDFLGKTEESTAKINDWVKSSTHGKLPMLFSQPLPSTTVSLMANVVYFSGTWETPFDPNFTTTGSFFINETHQVDASFMFGEKELLYKNTSELQLIGIPYKNWEVVLYVLLPHNQLETSLSAKRLDDLIRTAKLENITLGLPKMKMLSTISVRQSILKYLMNGDRTAVKTVIVSNRTNGKKFNLIKTGRYVQTKPGQESADCASAAGCAESTTVHGREVTVATSEAPDALGPAQDFDVGGASEDPRFRIDDVIHQVSMEIDERGSEIAAVTTMLIDYSGDNFRLKINRPFWFFVRHETTSTHLFWGRIVNPNVDQN